MKRMLVLVPAAAVAGLAGLSSPAVAGVSGPAFYVHGTLYRTVATPTDLSRTGAPDRSFDTIYDFGGAQRNVATAAPGDRDYNGGRWQVHALGFPNGYAAALAAGDTNDNGVLDTAEEVWTAMGTGDIVDSGVVKEFVCTVNRVPANG